MVRGFLSFGSNESWIWGIQHRLAAQFDTTSVVNIDDLDLDDVSELQDFVDIAHESVSEFADMNHSVGAWCEFDECSEFLDGNDATFVDRSNFDLCSKSFDFSACLRCRFCVGAGDEDSSIFFDVDLRAGAFLNTSDHLAAWSNDLSDLLWIDLDDCDAWSNRRNICAWLVKDFLHLSDEMQSSFFRLLENRDDFVKQ